MKSEDLLIWAAYAIPFVLILVSASVDKLVEKSPWHWKHFYCGIDLMLAVLGAALVNILDLAKIPDAETRGDALAWTALFIAGSTLLLFVISGFHQDWGPENRYGRWQVFLLGFASNGIGVAVAIAFLKLKMKGFL